MTLSQNSHRPLGSCSSTVSSAWHLAQRCEATLKAGQLKVMRGNRITVSCSTEHLAHCLELAKGNNNLSFRKCTVTCFTTFCQVSSQPSRSPAWRNCTSYGEREQDHMIRKGNLPIFSPAARRALRCLTGTSNSTLVENLPTILLLGNSFFPVSNLQGQLWITTLAANHLPAPLYSAAIPFFSILRSTNLGLWSHPVSDSPSFLFPVPMHRTHCVAACSDFLQNNSYWCL